MDSPAFYRELDDLLELKAGTVGSDTVLKELEEWDSVAVISLIAMVDDRYDLILPPRDIAECATAGDLAGVLEQLAKADAR